MSTQQTKPKGLYPKLAAAAADVTHVEKKGRNTQQGYDYVTASDIAAAARGALLARGVVADFSVVDCHESPIESGRGAAGLMVKAVCELIVTDSETGESTTRRTIGFGADFPGDKAIYKAMTGARKYAFIHLLQIPTGDDPEQDTKDGGPGRAKPTATATSPKGSGTRRGVTAPQKGKVHALCAEGGLSPDEVAALVQFHGGVAHLDRMAAADASKLIDALEAGDAVEQIRSAAATDERARKIAERYLP